MNIEKHVYSSIELFAGCGGSALGLEKAGFHPILLNEIGIDACGTLKKNKPNWPIVMNDITKMSFKEYFSSVDLVSGGFPCQAFSYAGKKLGFSDTRGTMFFEFARAIEEIQPKMFIVENVKGLVSHNKGDTLHTIISTLTNLGYTIQNPKVLNAVDYLVPQKRERLIIIGIRNNLANKIQYEFPLRTQPRLTLKDALKKGVLYNTDVPDSLGHQYSESKIEVLKQVPPGGCWRNLPIKVQKEYMQKSFYLSGGKTGIARRIRWDEPSLTLTCSPTQKQTGRCHPDTVRPFTVREYARIQTFPDSWQFQRSISSQYKQIGNALPVNLAYALGVSCIKALESDL